MKLAVIGAGYWGPNLMRNVVAHPSTTLRWVCDRDIARAKQAARLYPEARVTDDLDDLLNDGELDGAAVATPAGTHTQIVGALLAAGKHVLVEKPLAPSSAEGRSLVEQADAAGLVLMCDHTFCYTAAVQKIRELIAGGTIGAVQFFDSVRINLGLVQRDVDVFWDLAPHDLSILDHVLPADQRPLAVAAHGADPIGAGRRCVGYLTLRLPGDAMAHVHVNWLSPTKIRTTIVGGSKRTIVWDDVNPAQRLSVFDRGVELARADEETLRQTLVSYRSGDMVAPARRETEALSAVIAEFVGAVAQHRAPLTDGRSGLRVVEVLEAADRSLAQDGAFVDLA